MTSSDPSQTGPGRPSTIQPVRSPSTQLAKGRSRSAAISIGGAEPSAGPTRRVGLTSSRGSGTQDADRGEPPPVRGVGRPARVAGRRQDLARVGVRGIHVDGPDGRARADVGLGSAVARERDRPAVRAPGDVRYAPVARGDLPRPRAGRGVNDEQVRPVVEVPELVESPVRPRDSPGRRGRLVRLDGGRATTRACGERATLPDDEPRRIDRRCEREPRPVRRPGDGVDAPVLARPDLANPAAAGRYQVDRGRAVLVVRPRADPRYESAVRGDRRLAIHDDPGGERPRPTGRAAGRERDGPQVGDVAVTADRAATDDREAAVGGQVELFEDHLAADVFGLEGAARRHRRQGRTPASRPGHTVATRDTTRTAGRRVPFEPMLADRIVLAPEVARALAEGRARRGPRIDPDQPRPPVPGQPRGRDGVRGGRPGRRRHPGDRRGPRGTAAHRPRRRRAPGARDRAGRVGPQGVATEPRGGGRIGRAGPPRRSPPR